MPFYEILSLALMVTFILSLFLGYAYRQTHRVFPSWIIHTGINGFTMLNMWILYLYGGVK